MGSAHYLAPETTQGKEPNEQVDIYSLGIVFYELLTGKFLLQEKHQRKSQLSICVSQCHMFVILIRTYRNR